jgi:putative DNA primase/helicase
VDSNFGGSESRFQPNTNGQWAEWFVRTFSWYIFPVWGIDEQTLQCQCGDVSCRKGKHPHHLARNGHHSASNDPEQIAAWWSQAPTANIGVDCGRSGLVVLDCDGDTGTADLLNWCASFDLYDLPPTLHTRTGGGGEQFIFAASPNHAIRSMNAYQPNNDVKALGGYVVLPPSLHASGHRYEILENMYPTPLPEVLAQRLMTSKSGAAHESTRAPGAPSYIFSEARKYGAKAGYRDEFFNALAFQLKKNGSTEPEAFAEVKRVWELTEQPDGDEFTLQEAVAKLIRVYRNDSIQPDPIFEWPGGMPSAHGEVHSASASGARLGDDGNALLFAEQHLDTVRYAIDAKRWHQWDGRRWTPNADTVVLDMARQTVRSLAQLAAKVTDDDGRRKALSHAFVSSNAGHIEAILRLAKSDPRLAAHVTDFDQNPWLLNTPTGTYDFEHGHFRQHQRDAYLSKITSVGYDAGADAPQFAKFLRWAVGDSDELMEFIQRAVGYAITGDTSEQVFFLLYGTGANGKTTFLNIIETILGDYAWHAEPELLTRREGSHPTGIADLHGKRFIVANETREGGSIDEQTLKQLTGQDTITARRMYQDFFAFRPTHTIFFAVNNRPVITDDSYAMWRRVLLVPFEQRMEPDRQVKDLAEQIVRTEGPGVLRWMVEGAMKWKHEGGLLVPAVVKMHTENYQVSEDAIGAFIVDYLERVEGAFASTKDIQRAYDSWCFDQSIASKDKLGHNQLMQRLETRLVVKRQRVIVDGKRPHGFPGVKVTGGITGTLL